ncbi:MAG: hypothetical protein ACYCW6_17430, partial [Candidatus Xenobia bacterium]
MIRRLAVAALLLVAALAVGCRQARPSDAPSAAVRPTPQGIDLLAHAAPADSALFLAVDLRGRTTLADQVQALQHDAERDPPLQQRMDEVEQKLGVPLAEIAAWLAPAGFMVALPPAGQKGLVSVHADLLDNLAMALVVTDEKAARESLGRMHQPLPFVWTVASGMLVLSRTQAAVDRVVAAMHGQPALTAMSGFQEARRRLSGTTGMFLWVGLQDTLQQLQQLPALEGQLDDTSMQALRAAGYLAASVVPAGDDVQSDVLLKLDPHSPAPLVHALLEGQTPQPALARFFPAHWGTWGSGNLAWLYPVVTEALKVPVRTRTAAAWLPEMCHSRLGVDLDRDVMATLSGPWAVASNAVDLAPAALDASLSHAREKSELADCEANEKTIGNALEMYSVDHGGRYPRRLGALVPNYLKLLPTCPAAGHDSYSKSYKAAADGYSF